MEQWRKYEFNYGIAEYYDYLYADSDQFDPVFGYCHPSRHGQSIAPSAFH
jgi:hypothetical protein